MTDKCEKFKLSLELKSFLGIRNNFYLIIIKCLIVLIIILLRVAFLTLLERKILRLIGLRLGPNKVSQYGLLQPMADALKLANKQVNLISINSIWFYYTRRIIIFHISLILWRTLIFSPPLLNTKFTAIIIIILLGVRSLKVIIAGWRTFRKYPLLGILRTIRQLISYESVIYLCLLSLIYILGNFNFNSLIFFPLITPGIIIPIIIRLWIPSVLADLNRTPYDFRERERELVRGYNTEFGSRAFTLIFLREYRNILFIALLTRLILLTVGSLGTFLSFLLSLIFILWIRATFPRIRFDKLIIIAWKTFIPIITLYLIIILLI